MSRIFISHSSRDNTKAIELRDWLTANGWDDIFLDLDPADGLAPGERWQNALKAAADRCEAVLFLISPNWLQSAWCLSEFLLAKQLGKRLPIDGNVRVGSSAEIGRNRRHVCLAYKGGLITDVAPRQRWAIMDGARGARGIWLSAKRSGAAMYPAGFCMEE
jgi:TIR domain